MLEKNRKVRFMDMSKTYNPKEFEEKLYKEWEKKGYFRAEADSNNQPFFRLLILRGNYTWDMP